MEIFLKSGSVFLIGLIETWGAIPVGFAFGLHPLLIGTLVLVSAMTAAAIVLFTGDKLRKLIESKLMRGNEEKRRGKLQTVLDKYGATGFGLIAPWVTGVLIGTIIGATLGIPSRKLFIWLGIGTLICVIVLVLLGWLGVKTFFEKQGA